ncbi:hypothetical protein [Lactiplantibacillus mudanjiangensis]|uniref:Uncharacterized protein n=1 Tax=Lactiplantibacillus mudanjiangensis TaxID=1296538 RepID=A0A660DYX2_9LACO|nr:hypothetical protein [Lactiplantibacillus mudanjiangensis]VDG24769.1 hypothetical protein MUDAN_IGPPGNFN_00802 [Lactiplantibacillus mudanjiangensis]VDG28482.1 hypothetical protein MUDAN_MDHGFNIF_00668 [Lactiplantibacillus mudanjiangensis]VDG32240.1 hypothetical protein MUDAN_DOGOELCO_01503 [Lactiplantibacillus mudanjiangensis]
MQATKLNKNEVYNKFIKKMNGRTAAEVEREALNAIRRDLGKPSLEAEAKQKKSKSVVIKSDDKLAKKIISFFKVL